MTKLSCKCLTTNEKELMNHVISLANENVQRDIKENVLVESAKLSMIKIKDLRTRINETPDCPKKSYEEFISDYDKEFMKI